MTTNTAPTNVPITDMLARLVRDHPELTDLDRNLIAAFERLMANRPAITDGTITVTNICAEAGVSRASYYRSPVAAAVKEILTAPQTRRPEPDELRHQVTRLKQAERALRSEHATEVRELKATVATYANQIQALALRTAELEDETRRLRDQLARTGLNVVPLPSSSLGGVHSSLMPLGYGPGEPAGMAPDAGTAARR